VLTLCWFYKLKVGDLVVFKKDRKEMVKRIQKIDDRCIFVIGDNPKESTDSRHFGWIDKKEIMGKIIWVVKG
ncbi:MAG: S26 family signal peptidase, partial [Candidatus Daviesbacteria bacterium]|nr:S26 family signal peptidase [Candidatus Daviesbacteria bacterium]